MAFSGWGGVAENARLQPSPDVRGLAMFCPWIVLIRQHN
jgi:hypothetical protein